MASVSIAAELTFAKLILAADDYGRMDARPRFLKAALYPFRDEVSPEKIAEWVAELDADGCVQLYAIEGKTYLQLTGWERHRGQGKRGKASKYPAPNGERPPRYTEEPEASVIPADPRGLPGDPSGGRGTGDGGRCSGDGKKPSASRRAPRAASGNGSAPGKPKPSRRCPEFSAEEKARLYAYVRQKRPDLMPEFDEILAEIRSHEFPRPKHDWIATAQGWFRRQPAAQRARGQPPPSAPPPEDEWTPPPGWKPPWEEDDTHGTH